MAGQEVYRDPNSTTEADIIILRFDRHGQLSWATLYGGRGQQGATVLQAIRTETWCLSAGHISADFPVHNAFQQHT
jgi:hypothetical protein